jgi:hypothetical protein
MKSTEEIVKRNSLLNERMVEIEVELRTIKGEIRKNDKFVWDNCEHVWVDQQDSSMYEKSTYKCSKCKLINDSRLYTIRR